MHFVGASERVRRDLGKADRADRARFDEPRQFSDRVFDRDRFVDAMNVVEVDVVDAKPLPRAVEGFADVGRAVVEEARAVVASPNGEFGRERHSAAAAFVLHKELDTEVKASVVHTQMGGKVRAERAILIGVKRLDRI